MNWSKSITTILVAVSVMPWCGSVFAQEAQETQETEVKGFHPYKEEENTNVAPDFSHWSLMLEAGFNSFDGDFSSEMKHPVYAPSIGLGVEYTFNPYIGIGVNYMFDMYRVTGNQGTENQPTQNAEVLLKGTMHRVGIYLPVDVVTCFVPNATKRLFNIQLFVGGGLGWYKNSIYFAENAKHNTLNAEAQKMDKYKFHPYYSFGGDFEFNLSRSMALGIRGSYAYFTHDDLDSRWGEASKNNDGIFDVTLSVRYKIAAQKHSHERNVLPHRISRILSAKVGNGEGQNGPTPAEIAQNIVDNGLLPIGKDTVYFVSRDTIVMLPEVKGTTHYVYFANDKSNLDDQALIKIQQVAPLLQRDTTLYAFIVGNCDNTGSEEYNNALSEKRAANVAEEFIEEYGIEPERIYGCGEGKIIGRRSKASYTPNRRAEILLLSKEEFNKKKQAVVARETDDSPVAVLETVIIKQGMTLAALAEKYYGNTADWQLIYNANKEKLSNPDKLTEGMKIIIPAKQ